MKLLKLIIEAFLRRIETLKVMAKISQIKAVWADSAAAAQVISR